MSGIPVYTQSPITAAKADGVTPQTAGPETSTKSSAPASKPATTTAVPSTTSPYAPQPGQPAVPAPTGSLGPSTGPANNYTPSPTTKTADQGPPAPQPGAVPTAPGRAKSPLPPPPKVGEKYTPPEPAPQTTSPPYPPQMGFAPPANQYQPTATASQPSGNYPTTLPVQGQGQAQRRSFEHPPGYQQNPYGGGGMTGDQYGGAPQPSHGAQSGQWHRAGDIDDNAGEESIWETAKKWATTAGGKLAETEAEIWKRVNGEK
ncbi:hypothetical protein V497_01830 [Pseudogymnoascus sp. VKM F-4516 (FW-969)]|nr:hypothetical protein V497_01830 [Pseudogymnoascus sp. VKM F-4516 (FW-969)]